MPNEQSKHYTCKTRACYNCVFLLTLAFSRATRTALNCEVFFSLIDPRSWCHSRPYGKDQTTCDFIKHRRYECLNWNFTFFSHQSLFFSISLRTLLQLKVASYLSFILSPLPFSFCLSNDPHVHQAKSPNSKISRLPRAAKCTTHLKCPLKCGLASPVFF